MFEGTVGAVQHAATSHLDVLEAIQRRFISGKDFSEKHAFLDHTLSPLELRRWSFVPRPQSRPRLGICSVSDMFLAAPPVPTAYATRKAMHTHTWQLVDNCNGSHKVIFSRSLFGMVKVYNFLPQYCVDAASVRPT